MFHVALMIATVPLLDSVIQGRLTVPEVRDTQVKCVTVLAERSGDPVL